MKKKRLSKEVTIFFFPLYTISSAVREKGKKEKAKNVAYISIQAIKT